MKSLMKNSWKLKQSDRLLIATSLSAIGLASYLFSSKAFVLGFSVGDLLLIIAAILAGLPIAKTALSSLRYKIIGIDLLVIIAVIGAIIIGEYWEAAAVSILFTFGHYLEARALNKTRSALESLVNEIPDTAIIERAGKQFQIVTFGEQRSLLQNGNRRGGGFLEIGIEKEVLVTIEQHEFQWYPGIT